MNNKLLSYFKLFRPWQYYKNILIFFGIVFSRNLTNTSLYFPLILGFIALCLISSVNYLINDLKDLNKDKMHPEKMTRPLASGAVSLPEAYFLTFLLFFLSIFISAILPIELENKLLFIGILLTIFATSQLYTLFFKHRALYDVTFIALNYIWRAVAGVIVINVFLSPWLFALGFLFALFLALAKRRGDVILLGEEAKKHRKVFEEYTLSLLDQFISIIIGAMIVAWSIYIIEDPFRPDILRTFTNDNLALLSIPLVTITALKLMMLLQNDSKYARRAEFLFLNREILTLGSITGIVIILSIYWSELDQFFVQFLTTLNLLEVIIFRY
ncbi:MAG: UbiA prenyltransferase family protein [Candidatus Hodarchaeales archaeon]